MIIIMMDGVTEEHFVVSNCYLVIYGISKSVLTPGTSPTPWSLAHSASSLSLSIRTE